MTEKQILATVGRLLAELQTHHERTGAIVDEINELLGGGPGIAAKVKDVQRAFQEAWSQRYRQVNYIWRHAVDVPHIKRLVKMLGVDEVKARIFNYLRCEDPFIAKSRHPFGLFVSGINSYANEGDVGELELQAPPVGCKHTPPCVSDHAHTVLKSREMRA